LKKAAANLAEAASAVVTIAGVAKKIDIHDLT